MNKTKDFQTEMKSNNMSGGSKHMTSMDGMSMDMRMTFNSKLPLNLIFEEIELRNSKGNFVRNYVHTV